jgi:hypothetical protein
LHKEKELIRELRGFRSSLIVTERISEEISGVIDLRIQMTF